MKEFFTKKRTIFATTLVVTLLTLIALLIVPLGSVWNGFWIYSVYDNKLIYCDFKVAYRSLTSPFTLGIKPYISILVEQTIVFIIVGTIFLVFLALFIVELAKAGVFKRRHRPTKSERIAELEKQVAELKEQQNEKGNE